MSPRGTIIGNNRKEKRFQFFNLVLLRWLRSILITQRSKSYGSTSKRRERKRNLLDSTLVRLRVSSAKAYNSNKNCRRGERKGSGEKLLPGCLRIIKEVQGIGGVFGTNSRILPTINPPPVSFPVSCDCRTIYTSGPTEVKERTCIFRRSGGRRDTRVPI